MEKSRNMQVRLGILAAAVVCLGMMPPAARALFGQNSQNRDDARRQNANAQDRDSQDRSNANSSGDEGTVTLPSGYVIPVRLADEVNSSHDKTGDLFTGTVDPSVLVNDHEVIPRGTEAHIRMVEDKKGGHLHGKAKVRLELVSLIINGERLGVDMNAPKKEKGSASTKASAEAKKVRKARA